MMRAPERHVAGLPTAEAVSEYRPPWWFRGRHLQTVWGAIFRRPDVPALRRERWDTPDGDFIDLDWLPDGAGPLLVILHGLEGSARSHYARGLLAEAARRGWRAVVVHFRSCSGEVNRRPRLYHSGETGDLDWAIRRLRALAPAAPVGIVGISLGGNVALKWLAEHGEAAPAEAAAAISTPFDLAACAGVLDRGLRRRLYTAGFLRTMKAKLRQKAALLDGLVDLVVAERARTFAEYDRHVTAPLHGFADEHDYWARSSSGPYLPRIRRPCLLINALNDPFVPPTALPLSSVAASPWLRACFPAQGGHVGFLDGPFGRSSWAEREAMAFLARHVGAPASAG